MNGPAGPTSRSSAAPTARELRRFGLTVGGAMLALAAVGVWRGRAYAPAALGTAGALLALVGAAAPRRLAGVFRAWMAAAAALSRVTTPAWLAVVYFGVFTPLGLVLRVTGRRALGRPRGAASYWVERPPGRRQSDLRRQF